MKEEMEKGITEKFTKKMKESNGSEVLPNQK